MGYFWGLYRCEIFIKNSAKNFKSIITLVNQVLMKDIVTPVPPEETRAVIKKCLENAALVNYTQLSNEAKLDGKKSANC